MSAPAPAMPEFAPAAAYAIDVSALLLVSHLPPSKLLPPSPPLSQLLKRELAAAQEQAAMLSQQLALALQEGTRLCHEHELLIAQQAEQIAALHAEVDRLRTLRQASLHGDPEERVQSTLREVRARVLELAEVMRCHPDCPHGRGAAVYACVTTLRYCLYSLLICAVVTRVAIDSATRAVAALSRATSPPSDPILPAVAPSAKSRSASRTCRRS